MIKEIGQPLFLPPFKGRIQPGFNRPGFLEAISDCHKLLDGPDSEILLDSRNRVGVASLPLEGRQSSEIVIKEYRCKGVDRLKSVIIPSKAFKAWRGGTALIKRGIKTPPPVAYLEKRTGLFLEQSFFLAERINGFEEIRYFFPQLAASELNELLVSLAQGLSLCHKKGVLHSDLSDGNILVKKEISGKFSYYFTDTNRIKLKKRIGLLKGIKGLIRLGVPPSFQRVFLGHYLGTYKVKKRLWFWYRINKGTYANYIKFKQKLKLRQLARKLKIQ